MAHQRRQSFRDLPVRISEQGLTIGGTTIVGAWEENLQRTLVRETVALHDRVLEIGYGLGFAAAAIRSLGPTEHVIIEAHPAVARSASDELLDCENVRIVCDFWQDQTPPGRPHRFHSIIYDPYPVETKRPFDGSLEMTLEFALDFLPHARDWLVEGGRCGFLDFSCKLASAPAFANRLLGMGFVSRFVSQNIGGPKSAYAPHSTAHILVVTT